MRPFPWMCTIPSDYNTGMSDSTCLPIHQFWALGSASKAQITPLRAGVTI